MSDRTYRLLFGLALLIALYFQFHQIVYGLIFLALVEGLTNLRVPVAAARLLGSLGAQVPMQENLTVAPSRWRFSFEAERILRLLLAGVLFLSFALWPAQLWFIPWFIGFALFGAGVSGVCPSLSLLKWLGFP